MNPSILQPNFGIWDKPYQRAGERKFVVAGTLARFCASDPTKDPQCKIQVIRGA